MKTKYKKDMKNFDRFKCGWFFVGWDALSLGLTISRWHIELHLPFGFLRIGWYYGYSVVESKNKRGFNL